MKIPCDTEYILSATYSYFDGCERGNFFLNTLFIIFHQSKPNNPVQWDTARKARET